nr:putative nuclease HARBI1 [Lytechinus pictus]
MPPSTCRTSATNKAHSGLTDISHHFQEEAHKRSFSIQVMLTTTGHNYHEAENPYHSLNNPSLGKGSSLQDMQRILTIDQADGQQWLSKYAFIKFPTGAEADRVKHNFFVIAGFPSVLGAVDCTHVGLNSAVLGANEAIYVNRKFWHSINVQMVCDAKYVITNVVARWPGSVHDARILNMSHLGEFLQNRRESGYLLGDSGYPLRRWIQTPFGQDKDDTPAKKAYNRAHARTRCLIEMTFGQLKKKFRCLKGHGMQVEPRRVCDVVVACVLYNIAKLLNEPPDEEADQQPENEEGGNGEVNVEENDAHEYQVGQMVQMDIVNDFFT